MRRTYHTRPIFLEFRQAASKNCEKNATGHKPTSAPASASTPNASAATRPVDHVTSDGAKSVFRIIEEEFGGLAMLGKPDRMELEIPPE
jgi:hypothetical protein